MTTKVVEPVSVSVAVTVVVTELKAAHDDVGGEGDCDVEFEYSAVD